MREVLMRQLCKKAALVLILIFFCLELSGCGETVQGVKKDAQRMGKGVRTIFIRESN
jgi:predicted small secreted protein